MVLYIVIYDFIQLYMITYIYIYIVTKFYQDQELVILSIVIILCNCYEITALQVTNVFKLVYFYEHKHFASMKWQRRFLNSKLTNMIWEQLFE